MNSHENRLSVVFNGQPLGALLIVNGEKVIYDVRVRQILVNTHSAVMSYEIFGKMAVMSSKDQDVSPAKNSSNFSVKSLVVKTNFFGKR